MSGVLDQVATGYPALFDVLDELVTVDRLFTTLRRLAETPAPSQTAALTRGPVVAALLEEWGIVDRGAKHVLDLRDSGSGLVEFGADGARIVAHLDEISYVLRGGCRDGVWPLTPYCYHLADGPRAARVIRYEPAHGYGIVSHGRLVAAEDDLSYVPDDAVELRQGDRVTLTTPTKRDGTRVKGCLDNAAGVAAALHAAETLTHAEIPYSVLLPDEEEGPAGRASQTISRGATRAFRALAPAPLTIVVDIHGLRADELAAADAHRVPWGASLAEYSSATRGSVTPPHLYRPLADLADELSGAGIAVRPNLGGYIPRSDDIAAMLHSNRVCILGYPGINRHFDHGLPVANLEDLASLAKCLAVVAAAVCLGAVGFGATA